MPWARKPKVETTMPAAMSRAPRSPRAARITSVAGAVLAARPGAPSARRHTTLTER